MNDHSVVWAAVAIVWLGITLSFAMRLHGCSARSVFIGFLYFLGVASFLPLCVFGVFMVFILPFKLLVEGSELGVTQGLYLADLFVLVIANAVMAFLWRLFCQDRRESHKAMSVNHSGKGQPRFKAPQGRNPFHRRFR